MAAPSVIGSPELKERRGTGAGSGAAVSPVRVKATSDNEEASELSEVPLVKEDSGKLGKPSEPSFCERRPATSISLALVVIVLLAIWTLSLDPPFGQSPVKEERAAVPSPRTRWSVRTPEQLELWFALHENLAAEAAAFKPAGPGAMRLVLLGDSITEAWRGTSFGRPSPRAEGVPAVLQEVLGGRWPSPLVLGISGDQTQHLLWRLQNGELPEQMASSEAVLFVVLIGTNNLGAGHSPEETQEGIAAVALEVLRKARGKLLLAALLPRGDNETLSRLCPPRCNPNGTAFRSFMPAIRKVNDALARSVASNFSVEFPGRVAFADCGAPFLKEANASGEEVVDLDLMPDALHPNAKGSQLLASCYRAALLKLDDTATAR